MKIMLDQGAKMPTRAHTWDAGLDLYTPSEVWVPKSICSLSGDSSVHIGYAIIDTGVHVEIPEGCVGFIKSKSGLNVKHGLTAEGVIDAHYTGSIVVKLYNHTDCAYRFNAGDKIAFVGENELAQTALFQILMGELEPDEGSVKWGISTVRSYLPKDNTEYFEGVDLPLIQWLNQYSKDNTETYLRGFLGRMLFSGDAVYKPVKVLSGGERVRCMFSRMMLFGSNGRV